METQEVLQGCTVEENVVKLPEGQLDRDDYIAVKKALELIGGKWKGGKVAGFVFNEDPTDLLAQIANGEKRNLKKEFQFFATPDKLADLLVKHANIKKGQAILEPSAGQGAIIKAIQKALPNHPVDCYELMPVNQTFLEKMDNVNFLGANFLGILQSIKYDRIIANPPFTKNRDIDPANSTLEIISSSVIKKNVPCVIT